MHHSRRPTLARVSALALAGLASAILASCNGDSTTGPRKAKPAKLQVISGNGQNGAAGEMLSAPIVAKVVDANGDPVQGVVVNFVVTEGGGSAFAGSAISSSQGLVKERWTLGTQAGVAQVMEARAVDQSTGDPIVYGVFTATAIPGPVATLVRLGGNGQTGAIGGALPTQLSVQAVDRFNNNVVGATVTWATTAGGGSLPATTTADDQGVARATWTLGGRLDVTHTATASAGTATPIAFTATPTLTGATYTLTKAGGDAQSAPINTPLPAALDLLMQLPGGQPVVGAPITFAVASGGGSLSAATGTTNLLGHATTTWTLGVTSGTNAQSVTAKVTGTTTPVATFTATGTTNAQNSPAYLSVSPDYNGTDYIGGQVQLTVRSMNVDGNVLTGRSYTYSSQFPNVATVDQNGLVRFVGIGWTNIEVTDAGVHAYRYVNVTNAPAGTVQVLDAGNFRDQVGTIGTPVTLLLKATNNGGQPVNGAVVAWSLASGSGTLGGMTSTTAGGTTTMTFTPGTVSGNNVVTATVDGVTAQYLVWTRHAAAHHITLADGNGQTGEFGSALPTALKVRVEDQYGNGVYDQPVTFAVTSGGGYVTRTTLQTDSLGYVSTFFVPGSVGTNTATATWSGNTVTFTANGTAPSGNRILLVSGNERIVGASSFAGPPAGAGPVTIRVVDPSGNPVQGATVTWTGAVSSNTGPTDASGQTSASTSVSAAISGTYGIAAQLANGSTANFVVLVTGTGGGVACGFQQTSAPAKINTRYAPLVLAGCTGRSGPSTPVPTPSVLAGGGSVIPAPGYRPAGLAGFYWILGSTVGTQTLGEPGNGGTNTFSVTAQP